jgi:8-oxo-dGTP pyrophosphatase MutT (NUDIX family)
MEHCIETISRGVFVNGRKEILLCKNRAGNFYYLPGGHIEWGESGVGALMREFKEETGIALEIPVSNIGVMEHYFVDRDNAVHHELNIIYTGRLDGGSIVSVENDITFEWIPFAEASEKLIYPRALLSAVLDRVTSDVDEHKPFFISEGFINSNSK